MGFHVEQKECAVCKEVKPLSEFHTKSVTKTYKRTGETRRHEYKSHMCKLCHNDYVADWYAKNREKKRERNRRNYEARERKKLLSHPKTKEILAEVGLKVCSQCFEIKELKKFYTHKKGWLHRTSRCKLCKAINAQKDAKNLTDKYIIDRLKQAGIPVQYMEEIEKNALLRETRQRIHLERLFKELEDGKGNDGRKKRNRYVGNDVGRLLPKIDVGNL